MGMKRNFLAIILISSLSLAACNAEDEPKEEVVKIEVEGPIERELTSEEKYQAIFDEYSEKMYNKTPILISEYKVETISNQEGINGLAEISTQKVRELAKISSEGTEKMAVVMWDNGNNDYKTYESWGTKLYEVYAEESSKLMDLYLESSEKELDDYLNKEVEKIEDSQTY